MLFFEEYWAKQSMFANRLCAIWRDNMFECSNVEFTNSIEDINLLFLISYWKLAIARYHFEMFLHWTKRGNNIDLSVSHCVNENLSKQGLQSPYAFVFFAKEFVERFLRPYALINIFYWYHYLNAPNFQHFPGNC